MSEVEKYSIKKEIKERVLDPNHKPKDFMDVIEVGLVGASELGRGDEYTMFKGLLDAELKLEENEEFVRLGKMMQDVRMQVVESAGISALSDIGKNPTFRKFADGQNKLRKQLIKVTQPTPAVQSILESITKVNGVLTGHKKLWDDKVVFHQTEADRLQKEIDELDAQQENAMQVEAKKSEMEVAYANIKLASVFVHKHDTDFVSEIYRKIEKDEKQNKYIIRKDTKKKVDGGVSKKQQAMLDDIYKMWIKYSSMMKGKLLKEDLFDTRERRYSNEECYNFIRAKYPKLENSTIEEYIRKYPKK